MMNIALFTCRHIIRLAPFAEDGVPFSIVDFCLLYEKLDILAMSVWIEVWVYDKPVARVAGYKINNNKISGPPTHKLQKN